METNKKEMSMPRLVLTMIVLGFCWSIVYLVPYLQYTWYDPLKEFIGVSNTKLGLLLSIYGLGNVFGAPIGGWIADRFNYKNIYILSVALNAVFALLFLVHPTYGFAILMWIGFAVASLMLNYPTHIKIVRNLAGSDSQGKIFGFNETFIGIGNIVLSSAMMLGFTKMATSAGGIRAAVIVNAVLSIVLAVLVAILLPKPTAEDLRASKNEEGEKSNFFKDFAKIAKQPATWLVGMSIFAVYSFMTTLTYFTPYFTQVMGVTVVLTGWASIARQYGMQIVGAPVGGILTDKVKSPAKVLLLVYVVAVAGLIYMLAPKSGVTVGAIIALTLVLSFFCYIGRGAHYATLEECGVDRHLSASTIGVAAILGFSPDLFQFTLFGHWMDTAGNTAFTYMFVYQLIVIVGGIIAALLILKMKKKNAA